MKNIYNILFVCIVMALLFAIPIVTLNSEKESFSVFENRNLAQKPSLTAESVINGEFFEAAENYYKDHICFRDNIIKCYTNLQINLFSKPVVSDIIINTENLLPYTAQKSGSHASSEEIDAAIDEIKALKKTADSYGGKIIYIGIPGQITMFENLYPKILKDIPSYNTETEKLFAAALKKEGIEFISARNFLSKENYFKTDHHYDITGGYKVYEAICNATDTTAVPESQFTYKTLPNTFYGSRSRKIYNLTPIKDSLNIIEPYTEIPFSRTDNGANAPQSVISLPADDKEIVSYNQYMGGDIAETLITTNRDELPDLLIYGDSYTNAVECFAYLSFNETRYIDLRHYSAMTLCEYVKKYKPDYIVCIRDDGNYTNLEGNGKLS
ncbi:MAG: hypothetical protein IKU52_04415 [Clostridia bacterium]|nr:hypothetical protein [Clostridia bacterium]